MKCVHTIMLYILHILYIWILKHALAVFYFEYHFFVINSVQLIQFIQCIYVEILDMDIYLIIIYLLSRYYLGCLC